MPEQLGNKARKTRACFYWLTFIVIGLLVLNSVINSVFAQTRVDWDTIAPGGEEPQRLLDTLLARSQRLLQADPELALRYCEAAYKLSDSLEIAEGTVDALLLKIRIYIRNGSMDSALVFCQDAYRRSAALEDLVRVGNSLYLEGVILYRTEGPIKALIKFRESYSLFLAGSDSAGMGTALNGIGAAFYESSMPDSSLYYYQKAVKLGEFMNDQKQLGRVYVNMGLLYDILGEFEKSKQYSRKSISINEKLGQTIFVANAINNIGNVYVLENKLDSAWEAYNKELELSTAASYIHGCADAYNGLGDIADNLGDLEKAGTLFKKAHDAYASIDNKLGQLIALINLGRIKSLKGFYQEALIIFDTSLQMAKEDGYLSREAEVMGNIVDNYFHMGNFRKAYSNQILLAKLKDSILNEEKNKRIADLTILFEVEKSRAENMTLKAKNLEVENTVERRTRQRNTYLFSGSGALMLLIFLFSYYSQRTRKNRIINEQRIHQLEEEKKLLAARSIVEGQEEERKRIARELHDGLGVLLSSARMHFTSLRDQTPENTVLIDKAAKLLEQATGDVRRISHNMMPGLLTKYGLYEALLDLFEQLDEMKGLHAKVEIEGEQARLRENKEIMLYRIVQEMVNNTLKHAGAKNIRLFIGLAADRLRFRYSDDGRGFDVTTKVHEKSMGLKSIQSRVKFLGGEVAIQSSPGQGMEVRFDVPAESEAS